MGQYDQITPHSYFRRHGDIDDILINCKSNQEDFSISRKYFQDWNESMFKTVISMAPGYYKMKLFNYCNIEYRILSDVLGQR